MAYLFPAIFTRWTISILSFTLGDFRKVYMLVIIPGLMTSRDGPAKCRTLPGVVLPTGDMLRNMMVSQLQFQTELSSTRISEPIKFFTGDSFDARKTIESPLDFDAMNTAVRTGFVKENIIALMCESSELLEWMPWKHWKSYENAEMTTEDISEARYEVIDMFHFLFNLSFCLGMSPEMVYDGFMRKQAENRDRQNRGY